MCKPNKSLRMTVRAFIKAEEKKKAAAAEAAAAAAIEQEEAAAQQSEQIAEQPQEESDVQAEPIVEQLEEESVDAPDATEGALAPEATDPLAQVEEVRPCQIGWSGRNFDVYLQVSEHTAAGESAELDQPEQPTGTEEETIAQSIEEADPEHVDVEQKNESESQQQNQNGQDASQQNFQSMDWNAANSFNPMMNMANGFNSMMGMMGELICLHCIPDMYLHINRHAWNEPYVHVRRLWSQRYGHARHEWYEHGNGLWRRFRWQLEWTAAGDGRKLWRWLLSQRWI